MATPDFTAGEVMNSSAALLNDAAKTVYTYAVQIPYLKMAMKELREFLSLSNIPVTNRVDTVLTIPANTTVISYITTPALPSDLVEIRQLWERTAGVDPYTPMVRKEFLPHWIDGQTNYSFLIWAWINNAIHVPECSQANDLKLDYIAQLSQIVDENSQIQIINGQSFLEYRTAALVAEYVGENKTRADDLNLNAQSSIDRTIGIENKAKQPIMTRHRPFRSSWKNRGLY
jgi:hypothetical protein